MRYANNLQDGDVIIRRHHNGWMLINVDNLDDHEHEETISLYQDVEEDDFFDGDYLPIAYSLQNCLKTAFAEFSIENADEGDAAVEFIVTVAEAAKPVSEELYLDDGDDDEDDSENTKH